MIGTDLALWVLYQAFGDHDFLDYLVLVDVAAVLMFAVIGILAAWRLAFRREALVRSIEQGIARRGADKSRTKTLPDMQVLESNRMRLGLATKPNAHRPSKHVVTIAVWAAIVLAAIILFLMLKSS